MPTHADIFAQHIGEVAQHFNAGDIALGGRRLIDCALDTGDNAIFRQTLAWLTWQETATPDGKEIISRSLDLLTGIENAGPVKTSDSNKVILDAKELHKKYAGSANPFGIKPVNIELQQGAIIGLVGENGNGKTTLLRLLAKELKPDGGQLHYNFNGGKDDYLLRTKLIYIEQRIPRWYGTLTDNLQFTLTTYGVKGEANYLLTEMMIARLGLRPYKNMTWKSISSGYRTRFEIARALLRKPQLLLLDEPLANLDIMAQQTILQDLKFMAASISAPFGMILSSQHIYEIEKVSDSVIFLKNGAPQYQYYSGPEDSQPEVPTGSIILEIETGHSRDALAHAFRHLSLDKITFNGGMYTLYFGANTTASDIFSAIATSHIPVQYLRDITHSSRRFFNN